MLKGSTLDLHSPESGGETSVCVCVCVSHFLMKREKRAREVTELNYACSVISQSSV